MIKPLSMIQNILQLDEESLLPSEFGLLCWNVHKQNLGGRFEHFFGELLERCPIDLLALQEVKLNFAIPCVLDSFHFSLAPNIRFFNHIYGVLNGSRVPEHETSSILSTHRESMIQTRKSAIFSTYPLPGGEMLLLANLHAINFRSTRIYNKEIEAIFEKIGRHRGAMIVTGDFNSWNRARIGFVLKSAGALHLQSIETEHTHLIKSFMNYKLDHIFYRGLQLVESHAVDVQKISDHNALYARFRVV